MKKFLIIIDGMQDITYKQLNGKTPLSFGEAGNILGMELMERRTHTPSGMEPDSFCCTLNLLGVAPDQIPRGRAFAEALANGIAVGSKDLVVRVNTVGIRDGLLSQSGAGDGRDLFQYAPYPIMSLGGYKNIMVIPEAGEYINDLVTFPPHQNLGRPLKELLCHGKGPGEALGHMTEAAALAGDGRRTLMAWSPSQWFSLPPLRELQGCDGAVVCAEDVVAGIALSMGMELVKVSGGTGDVDTALKEKAEVALECARRYDFVLLHINGADEAAHRRNPLEKADFLKRVDREVVGRIINALPADWELTVTSDHATLCSTGKHSAMAVDVYGKLLRKGIGDSRWRNV